MSNFEAFRWNISLSANLLFMKSVPDLTDGATEDNRLVPEVIASSRKASRMWTWSSPNEEKIIVKYSKYDFTKKNVQIFKKSDFTEKVRIFKTFIYEKQKCKLGNNQCDLTMGCVFPVFRRYWLLSYSYFYGALLIRFHIKFSTFVGNCLKWKLHFLIKKN